jgi:hypothetical protein
LTVKEPIVKPIVILCILAVAAPGAAAAQGVQLAPANPKTWDFSVGIGWLGGSKDGLDDQFNHDDWYGTFATSIDVGRYWTPHLKTEASATVTTEGDVYVTERFVVPGQPSPLFFSREHHLGLTSANLSASYQFFENAWGHPFLGAGVQLGWEHERIETPFPFAYGSGPNSRFDVPPVVDPERTTFSARPFVTGGAKLYVGERGFIRTDLSAAASGRGVTHVWWRVGAGIDF